MVAQKTCTQKYREAWVGTFENSMQTEIYTSGQGSDTSIRETHQLDWLWHKNTYISGYNQIHN